MKRSISGRNEGPFRAENIREGDPVELSHGRAILCLPTGGQGSRANLLGATVLGTDPAVESAGIDTGFTPDPTTLRAPDIAVGNIPNRPGWVPGAPPLAVEYADTGQNEAELKTKIKDLLEAGTKIIWVVRLTGPRRVEIYEAGQPPRRAHPGDWLTAPGILKNPVLVEALYDPDAAQEAALKNLLQRQGYSSLEAIREQGERKGREEGREEGREIGEAQALRTALAEIIESRGWKLSQAVSDRLEGCQDSGILRKWVRTALRASSLEEIF